MSRTRLTAFSVRHAELCASVALTWLVGRALLPDVLLSGGSAIALVVAIVALGVGAPLAERRRARLAPSPVRAAWTTTVVPAGVGAVMAGALVDLGHPVIGFNPWVAGLILLAWLVSSTRAPSFGASAAGLLAVAWIAASLVHATTLAVLPTPRAPWTALTPGWSTASSWLPAAILVGLVGVGAGTELWSVGARARPGHVWGAAGWSVLVTLALGGLLALAHESWVAPAARPVVELLRATPVQSGLAVLTALSVLHLLAPASARRTTFAEAITWAGALAWAGPDARAAIWHQAVPLALAAALADDARRLDGTSRLLAALASALALLALWLGWPPTPDDVGASLCAAGGLVTLVWVGGMRAVAVKVAS